jgi:hypothetical protein
MNKQTTPHIDQESRVPASAKYSGGRRDYSAFRLNALSLNADLAALGSADPSEPPTHWIMETDHLSTMVQEVAANMKKLAQLQGMSAPDDAQLAHAAIAELGYAHTARPAGAVAHLRFLIGLTVRCIAKAVALQAEISSAYRHGRQSA